MKVSHNTSNTRKRKADDDDQHQDDRMLSSPLGSPFPVTRTLPAHNRHAAKRSRAGPAGRPIALPRLLETLDAAELRRVIQTLSSRNHELVTQIEHIAPRPSVPSALAVLGRYEESLHAAFPFGGDSGSEYAYNRVRQQLMALLEALADFTPHFLPPHEAQITHSLQFLDAATDFIHRLPDWHSFQNQLHKQQAYEEISRAWVIVTHEAGKKAGGMHLVYGGWVKKIEEHHAKSNGKLQEVLLELASSGASSSESLSTRGGDVGSIRQEMLSGAYGSNVPVRVGPW